MRQAGTIANKNDAQRFSDYLLAQGITNKVDPSGEEWAIWVHDENQIERSREELAQFQAEPTNPRYKAAAPKARQQRREIEQKRKQAQRNFVDVRSMWASPWHRRPVTMAMIIISVIVFLMQRTSDLPYRYLPITSVQSDTLPEIESGELWRLVTPIFLHFGLLHIVFNMYWLYQLGTLIERIIGSWRYVLIVIVMAITGNVAQFVNGGPAFGGMSGVVYGLFGYAWVRGRLDPTSGFWLRPDIAFWMIGFFVICALGWIPNVANWAHGGGLISGAALGYLGFSVDQMRRNLRRRGP